ncbi:MAG TPA: 50S ribosomal protein L25 [Candidatus Paceibacterota bacterium]|nr:50S ribosomal protein L25 [Candidatus Paceibacterota bacterium]
MDLAAQPREITGKKVRALRREGLVPAELYGHGIKNMHLSVGVKDFNKILKAAGATTVVNLVINKEKRPTLIHEVGRDFLTGDIVSIDFHQIRMDEKITAKVPLEFTGEAPAIKEKGAVLNKAMAEIEVEALPNDLPHSITVDLSALDDLDKTIYVKDLSVPKGVEMLVEPETAVVTATPPVAEEEPVVAETVDVSAVKVETEEKKAERQAEKTKDEKAG